MDIESTLSAVNLGEELSSSQFDELRLQIKSSPDNLTFRAISLGYLLKHGPPPELLELFRWIVRNVSDHSVCRLALVQFANFKEKNGEEYEQIKQEWLKQLETSQVSEDSCINASMFFRVNGDLDLARKVLISGLVKDPMDVRLLRHLGYARKPDPEGNLLVLLEASLREHKTDLDRRNILLLLSRAAFDQEDYKKASEYSTALLRMVDQFPDDPVSQYAIHLGHTVLGLLCVNAGDFEQAFRHLESSASIKEEYRFVGEGPDLSLCKALIKANQMEQTKGFLHKLAGCCDEYMHKREIDLLLHFAPRK